MPTVHSKFRPLGRAAVHRSTETAQGGPRTEALKAQTKEEQVFCWRRDDSGHMTPPPHPELRPLSPMTPCRPSPLGACPPAPPLHTGLDNSDQKPDLRPEGELQLWTLTAKSQTCLSLVGLKYL